MFWGGYIQIQDGRQTWGQIKCIPILFNRAQNLRQWFNFQSFGWYGWLEIPKTKLWDDHLEIQDGHKAESNSFKISIWRTKKRFPVR